jgi:hypothetical protein
MFSLQVVTVLRGWVVRFGCHDNVTPTQCAPTKVFGPRGTSSKGGVVQELSFVDTQIGDESTLHLCLSALFLVTQEIWILYPKGSIDPFFSPKSCI